MKNDAHLAYLRENHLENNQSSAEEKTTDVHPWDLQNYRVFSPGIQRHHRNLAWKSAQNVCHFLRVTSCQQTTTITEWLSNKQKIHVLFELTCSSHSARQCMVVLGASPLNSTTSSLWKQKS